MNETLSLIGEYRYLIIFPLAAIEGPMVALAVGFLAQQDILFVIPSFFILIAGDMIPDSLYYFFGRYGNKKEIIEKYKHRSDKLSRNLELLEKLWQAHPKKTMFFGKLAYGLSIPILISAGLVKMSFQKFLEYSIPVSIFQYGILMSLGYYLGYSSRFATGYVRSVGLVISLVIVIITAYVLVGKYARKEIEEMEEEITQ